MNKYVEYKGLWLMRGSKAYELYVAGEMVALDKHLRQLDQNERKLHEKVSN